jgi:hypothetical protein
MKIRSYSDKNLSGTKANDRSFPFEEEVNESEGQE